MVVDTSSDIYGDCFVSYNVHSLIHIHQDFKTLQCGLQELSAFPFIKHSHSRKTYKGNGNKWCGLPIKKPAKYNNPAIGCDRNSWFLLTNNKICEVVGLEHETDHVIAKLYCFQRSSSFFTKPLNSKVLKICFLPKKQSVCNPHYFKKWHW